MRGSPGGLGRPECLTGFPGVQFTSRTHPRPFISCLSHSISYQTGKSVSHSLSSLRSTSKTHVISLRHLIRPPFSPHLHHSSNTDPLSRMYYVSSFTSVSPNGPSPVSRPCRKPPGPSPTKWFANPQTPSFIYNTNQTL